MKLSIIIPARNEAAMLPEILAALIEARQVNCESELIVVDNASTDATADIARAAGAIVVREEILTAAAARNAGARVATGDWLLFVDADATPSRGLFGEMLIAMDADQYDAGSCLIMARIFSHRLWNAVSQRQKRLAGAFLFIRASVFHGIGGFNPSMSFGEEKLLMESVPFARRVILGANPLVLRKRAQAE